jgi:Cu(I)/Ag(I) efflux system membrane fusion protein
MSKTLSQIGTGLKTVWKRAGDAVVVLLILLALIVGFVLRGGDGAGSSHANATEQQWYTCSMHPDVRMPNPDDLCPICNMALIPVGSEPSAAVGPREISLTSEAAALINVETVPAQRRFLQRPVRMVGRIAVDETRLSYITAYIPGRLDRLYVDYTGIAVRKGDHLAEIYSPQLLVSQQELILAQQNVDAMTESTADAVRRTNNILLKTAKDKLRLLGLTAEQINTIAKSGEPTDHITLYSPADGVVTERAVSEGSYVKEGERLYTVADLSRVWLMLDAYESDLAWLRYGQPVSFTVEPFGDETFNGTVAFISPVLDERTRTVRVRVNVENPDGRLRPGMFARGEVDAQIAKGGKVVSPELAGKWISPMHPEIVKDGPGQCDICGMPLVRVEELGYEPLRAGEVEPPLVVPDSAVLKTGERGVVYVQTGTKDEPKFEGRVVKLGPTGGDYQIVIEGLAEGELVAVRGNFLIDSALQIQAKPSMMNQDGSAGGGDPHAGHTGHGEMPSGMSRDAYYVPPMPSVSFADGLPRLLEQYRSAEQAVWANDLDIARTAMRDLRRAFTAMPQAAPDDHSLAETWSTVRPGIEAGLREALVADDLASLRSAFDTVRKHVSPLTASGNKSIEDTDADQ